MFDVSVDHVSRVNDSQFEKAPRGIAITEQAPLMGQTPLSSQENSSVV
jgi:hypothetical protein